MPDALYAKLLAEATVTALLGSGTSFRLYPVKLPENPTYPAATYQSVSEPSIQAHSTGGYAARSRIQLSVWSDSYATCRTVLAAIQAVIDGRSFTAAGVTVSSSWKVDGNDLDYTAGARIFGVAHDYAFIHS